MITGRVTPDREARVEVAVRGTSGDVVVDAIIDTGFDGSLTLPENLVLSLGLPIIGRGQALLANGSLDEYSVCQGTVIWDGQEIVIDVDIAETEPLIGMALLYGYDLHIPVIDGGTVIINKLPF